MKRLVINVLAIVFLAVHCTGFSAANDNGITVHKQKRRDADKANADQPDTGVITGFLSVLDTLEYMPLVGSSVHFGRTWTYDTFNALQVMTNGGIVRVCGGALPCVISIENGLQCSGITEENNIAELIMELVKQFPLPEFLDGMVHSGLKMSANPIANILFGGVTVPT